MKKLNKYSISLHSGSNYFLVIVFAVLVPFSEWPDTSQHWHIKNSYANLIDILAQFFKIQDPTFLKTPQLDFFSDTYFFYSFSFDSINLLKLIFIITIFYFLNLISLKYNKQVLIFSPPYIFSLLSISNEPFSIALITISYIFCLSNKFIFSTVIVFCATLIDRSAVPSLLSILVMIIYINFNLNKLFFLIIFSFFFLFLILNLSLDPLFSFYNITIDDFERSSIFGKKKYFSLIASLSGLYGWLTLRPFFWVLYYIIIIFFFIVGFIKSDHEKKIFFLICFFFSFLTLEFLPSLGQARYYPILTLLYWELIIIGVKNYFKRVDFFIFSVILMTILGLFFPKFI
jgi:hypothetical protein